MYLISYSQEYIAISPVSPSWSIRQAGRAESFGSFWRYFFNIVRVICRYLSRSNAPFKDGVFKITSDWRTPKPNLTRLIYMIQSFRLGFHINLGIISDHSKWIIPFPHVTQLSFLLSTFKDFGNLVRHAIRETASFGINGSMIYDSYCLMKANQKT